MQNLVITHLENSVKITDLVSGITVKVDGPHQHKNERKARNQILKKMKQAEKDRAAQSGRRKSNKPARNMDKYAYSDSE